ncbi:MAG: hypothetical protein WD877_00350 [Candidatus Saccharimonadales bacterium]
MNDQELAQAVADYQPPAELLAKISQVRFYAFVGPYGSGKDSIMDYLESHHPDRFARAVGDASRPPRPEEKEGVQYHFRTKENIKEDLLARRFIEITAGFSGYFYGSRLQDYPVGKIAVKAIMARHIPKFRALGFKEFKRLHIVPKSYGAWQGWLNTRRFKPEDQAEREAEAIESLALSLSDPQTCYILNDEIEMAAQRVIQIADGRRPVDETEAKQIAASNLEFLKRRHK